MKTTEEIKNILGSPLKSDEKKYRVGNVNVRNGEISSVTLLAYIDARTAITRLNNAFGLFGWSNDVEEFKDGFKSTLSIKNPENGEWVKKVDVGTESNVDKLKGGVSDAFKRVCVLLEVGLELYEGTIWAKLVPKGTRVAIKGYSKKHNKEFYYIIPNTNRNPEPENIDIPKLEKEINRMTKEQLIDLRGLSEYLTQEEKDALRDKKDFITYAQAENLKNMAVERKGA